MGRMGLGKGVKLASVCLLSAGTTYAQPPGPGGGKGDGKGPPGGGGPGGGGGANAFMTPQQSKF